eukprot:TRINITY_DN25442_c0_g1_i1.p1 TRINITY_DN25442_c0_g1~~TRINITY_DN25442_c0_g1_i1.p1  ORF type:complete len:903 (+),score=181.96 TRINITY_DN25442_c0_g1_i1:73-2781(+)
MKVYSLEKFGAEVDMTVIFLGGSLLAVLAVLAVFGGMGNEAKAEILPKRRMIQQLSIIRQLLAMATASIIIPEAYSITLEMGYSAPASGMLIGISFILNAAFAISAKSLVNPWNQEDIRQVCIFVVSLFPCFCLLYAVAANPPGSFGWTNQLRFAILIISRMCLGISGAVSLLMRMMAQKVSPEHELVPYNFYRMALQPLGLGVGPLLSTFTCSAVKCDGVRERAAAPLVLMSFLWVLLLLAFQALPKDIDELLKAKQAEDAEMGAARAQEESSCQHGTSHIPWLPAWCRQSIILCGMIFGLARALMVSQVESGTAMLLQVEFGWTTQAIALGIGLSLLGGLPSAFTIQFWRRRMTDSSLLCFWTGLLVLAVLLLFPQVSAVLVSSDRTPLMLLMLDSFFFSALYLASGVFDGIAAVSALPGTLFSQENYILCDTILQNSLARFAGPILARYYIEEGGRTGYAVGMVLLAILGCFLAFFLKARLEGNGGFKLGHALRRNFILQDNWIHFDTPHGGLMLSEVAAKQQQLRNCMYAEPGKWVYTAGRSMIPLNLDALAKFAQVDAKDIVFVDNASSAIAAVVKSIHFQPADRMLVLDEVHDSVWNARKSFAPSTKLMVMPIALAVKSFSKEEILSNIDAYLAEHAAELQHVRFFVLSHIVSRPPALLPVKEIAKKVREVCPNVLILCDGAQSIGQLAKLEIQDLGVDFYLSSLHKWLCGPPGTGMLWVKPDHQDMIQPPVSRFDGDFKRRFVSMGLKDQTGQYVIKDLLEVRENMLGVGGEERCAKYCQKLIEDGACHVAETLGTEVFPAPGSGLTCSTACVRLPMNDAAHVYQACKHVAIIENMHFTVFNNDSKWYIRLGASVLLEMSDFHQLAKQLKVAIEMPVKDTNDSGKQQEMIGTFSV